MTASLLRYQAALRPDGGFHRDFRGFAQGPIGTKRESSGFSGGEVPEKSRNNVHPVFATRIGTSRYLEVPPKLPANWPPFEPWRAV